MRSGPRGAQGGATPPLAQNKFPKDHPGPFHSLNRVKSILVHSIPPLATRAMEPAGDSLLDGGGREEVPAALILGN